METCWISGVIQRGSRKHYPKLNSQISSVLGELPALAKHCSTLLWVWPICHSSTFHPASSVRWRQKKCHSLLSLCLKENLCLIKHWGLRRESPWAHSESAVLEIFTLQESFTAGIPVSSAGTEPGRSIQAVIQAHRIGRQENSTRKSKFGWVWRVDSGLSYLYEHNAHFQRCKHIW